MARRKIREAKSKFYGTKQVLKDLNVAAHSVAHDLDATTTIPESFTIPPGTIFGYGGTSAPAGYLLCNGAAVSRSTYVNLLSAIGTAYGVGDGVTTFNIPDLRNRFPAGLGATYTGLGATGGTINHTHDAHSAHTASAGHGTHASGGSHTHDAHTSQNDTETTGAAKRLDGPDTHSSDGGHQHDAHSAHTASTGHGTHAVSDPPYQVVNFIIKT